MVQAVKSQLQTVAGFSLDPPEMGVIAPLAPESCEFLLLRVAAGDAQRTHTTTPAATVRLQVAQVRTGHSTRHVEPEMEVVRHLQG